MSRTYRRTANGNKACWLPMWDLSRDDYLEQDYFNWYNTPGHWIHDYHEVPLRRRTRDRLRKIVNGYNYLEDEIKLMFDNGKKPHIYYW